MNLVSMIPRLDLSSTTYCLANPGSEYLVFAPVAGAMKVELSGKPNDYVVEWLSIDTGEVSLNHSISSKIFSSPFSGPAVAYLKKK